MLILSESMLDERHFQVLQALVSEFTQTAEPVSSDALVEVLRLGVSPATMRTILRELAEAGYVEQPHTSAGRVPTDKGYRQVLDHSEDQAVPMQELKALAAQFAQLQEEYRHLARATSKLLSRLTHAAAMSGYVSQRDWQEAGLREVLRQPEANSMATMREMAEVMEDIDRYVTRGQLSDEETQVFIGGENPFFPAHYTSMVLRTTITPAQEKVALVIIGPKRMFYQRNIALVNALAALVKTTSL